MQTQENEKLHAPGFDSLGRVGESSHVCCAIVLSSGDGMLLDFIDELGAGRSLFFFIRA